MNIVEKLGIRWIFHTQCITITDPTGNPVPVWITAKLPAYRGQGAMAGEVIDGFRGARMSPRDLARELSAQLWCKVKVECPTGAFIVDASRELA